MSSADSSLSVYIEHRAELLHYANRFVRDPAKAEDVVQEAWLRLSAKSGTGEEVGHTLSYLYAITRNLALDWARRARWEVLEAPDSTAWRAHPAQTPSPEHVLVQRDQFRAVMDAVSKLPERTQTAFRLYKLEEKTLQQIADALGVSVSRAHQMVRDGLACATKRLFGEGG